jgi:CHAT domain-containing protein
MSGTRRLMMTTMLIACALLSVFARAVFAQDPTSRAMEEYQRGAQALQLSYQAEELYRTGRYDEGIPLAERAVELNGGSYTEINVNYSLTSPLNILAKLYRAKGDYARAEETFLRLLKKIENSSGTARGRLPVAVLLNELATLYEAKGDFARALQYRLRGNELIERNLALTMTPSVETKSATDGWEALRNRGRAMLAGLTGAESYRQSLLDSLARETSATISLHIRSLPQDRQAAQLALTTILQRKGRVLDAMTDQLNVLRRYGNAQDQKLIGQLTRAYTRAATLSNEGGERIGTMARMEELRVKLGRAMEKGEPTEGIKDEIRKEADRIAFSGMSNVNRTMQTQQELGELEGAISQRSTELRRPEPSITLSAVHQAIPSDAALVEIITYQPFNAKARTEAEAFSAPHYAAYVVRRSEDVPQWVELGEAAAIDQAVKQLRGALRDQKRADVKELARALDERVMRPVRKLLGPTRRILLAPDGAFNLIPFAALVDEKNQYLIENYSINYLTSGRDLLRLQVGGESRDEPRVFANPLFDLPGGKQQSSGNNGSGATANPTGISPIAKDLKAVNYRPLPGTAAEATALGHLFPKAMVLTKEGATEAALKSVNRPRLLHIATHGFFLANQSEEQTPETSGNYANIGTQARLFLPLLRSGLVLAGVRQGASGADEDGVLTALEMVGMDLWGTKLVVLSACETGLGDVKNGEGVYGLRRALVLTGSETQIMSLWKVSDAGTRDLMVAYYTRLQRGESRIEAIRQVQLAMLRGELLPGSSNKQLNVRDTGEVDDVAPAKDYRHPYYWAAFIPSGDWRNMEGKEAQSQ